MLVEDEPLLRIITADLLRANGLDVIEARSGDEARELMLCGIRPDVIVTDMRMPGELDGAGLARWVSRFLPRVPVLLVSGDPRPKDLPIVDFLSKPFSAAELAQRVAIALGENG